LQLTDAKAMRAMAHPVRMALLEILAVRTLTATQASELLGESPANCAFHLRTLGKYGFAVEAGGGRGRERPWKSAHKGISLNSDELADPKAKLAAKALAQVWHERLLDRIRRVFSINSWPAGWEAAPMSSRGFEFLTAAETIQVARELHAVLDRYAERRDRPELRPADALPVEFVIFGYPITDPALGLDDS
jgi:predicted ArsR family transcriptional regulator